MGTDWESYENVRVTVNRTFTSGTYPHAEVTLTVFNKTTSQDLSVTLDSSQTSRVIYIDDGTTQVIRIVGRPEDVFSLTQY